MRHPEGSQGFVGEKIPEMVDRGIADFQERSDEGVDAFFDLGVFRGGDGSGWRVQFMRAKVRKEGAVENAGPDGNCFGEGIWHT